MNPVGFLGALVIFADAVGYHTFSGGILILAWMGLAFGANDSIRIKYKKDE